MTTGFTGISADLIIVFTFQTLFMAGLSLGGLLMTRRSAGIGRDRPALLKLELAIVLYWALLPLALRALYARVTHPLAFTSVQGILLLLNALAGFLVGSQFPLANRMWLKGREVAGGTAGLLYACDLAGAFLGSIVVSVVLIPILGILETCLVAALLKLASLLLVVALPPLVVGTAVIDNVSLAQYRRSNTRKWEGGPQT